MKPHLLLVNDDGIRAPGLKHLWRALKDIAEISVVAPVIDQSGKGLGITLNKPLHIEQIEWEDQIPAWMVSGTPADCVRMALSVLLEKKPDMIISGINRGGNPGKVVLYSGTVGGAIEGVLRGIPSLAFSCEEQKNTNYARTERYITDIVQHVLEEPVKAGTLLNVTFPLDNKEIRGVRLARQGRGFWVESPDERTHPEGRRYYWHGGKWLDYEEDDHSDVALLREGFITAVPIHVYELTDHEVLRERKSAFDQLFKHDQ